MSMSLLPKCAILPLIGAVFATAATTFNVTDYGAIANDGKNDVVEINKAIAAAKAHGGATIVNFPKGTYDIFTAGAPVKVYNVSNTVNANDRNQRSGRIGLHLVEMDSATLEGNGSLILFHNAFNNFIIDKCSHITFHNLKFDMARPSMSEVTCSKINSGTDIEYDVNEDSWYSISNGKLTWVGEDGWSKAPSFYNMTQGYNTKTIETWRGGGIFDPVKDAASVTEISKNKIRCTYSGSKSTSVGAVFQMRNTVRSEVFALINESSNISLRKVDAYYMHGFGIVAQYSSDITYDSLWAAPESGTTRTNAGMADFCQFSGNKGLITVTNSHFQGAHDDPINIHGTFLTIVAAPAANKIQVEFKHHESWGFKVFGVGDVIDFLKASTHLVYASRTVTAVAVNDDTKITLTLGENNPSGMALNSDAVENATYTPDVMISGNFFAASPTRGILCTTRGNVVIKDNTFHRMPMPALHIEDIIGGWYESGFVRNMTIYNNTFVGGGRTKINFDPNNTTASARVHRGIRILKNTFQEGAATITIRSSSGVYVSGNAAAGGLTNDFADTDVLNKLTYEAEAGTRLNGTAKILANDKCSDGQCVDGIGGSPSATLEVRNVYAPSAGNYTMTVYCLSAQDRTLVMSANGGAEITRTCNSGDGSAPDTVNAVFRLDEGVGNTIRFSNNSAPAPAVDKIEFVAGGAVALNPGPVYDDLHRGNPSISFNPLTHNVAFMLKEAGPVHLSIHNANGIAEKTRTVDGMGQFHFSLAGLGRGIYYASARGKNLNLKQRLLIAD